MKVQWQGHRGTALRGRTDWLRREPQPGMLRLMGMRCRLVAALAVVGGLALGGCTSSAQHPHGASPVRSTRGAVLDGVVRMESASRPALMTLRQATLLMLNSDNPPPLPEAESGVVRPVEMTFGRVVIDARIAHAPATRLSYPAAWIARWDEPVRDLSMCPNPKQPADPAPSGPLHRLFVLSDDDGGGTLYQSATINCGKAFPPGAGPASDLVSVPWHVSGRSSTGVVFGFDYPSCATPAGGQEHNRQWFVLVSLPLGHECAGTRQGSQQYTGRVPAAGRVGVVRRTAANPLAPPLE